MINLYDYLDEYVKLENQEGEQYLGFVDEICDAADNDEGTSETNQDGICFRIEDSGGLFIFQSDIKSIEILPYEKNGKIGRIK